MCDGHMHCGSHVEVSIFNFIGSSVIYLSLSEIPIWSHQRQFGIKNFKNLLFRNRIRCVSHTAYISCVDFTQITVTEKQNFQR
jgi:hypothetical protein